jgi:hypothetical protein
MKFEELDTRQHYKLQCNNLKFWCEILYLHFGHDFWLFSDIYFQNILFFLNVKNEESFEKTWKFILFFELESSN